jgi:Tol biopolymer transport system component
MLVISMVITARLSAQAAGTVNHYPIWAPDGRGILFDSNRDGDSEIYFMTLNGTEVRQLTDNEASEGGAH